MEMSQTMAIKKQTHEIQSSKCCSMYGYRSKRQFSPVTASALNTTLEYTVRPGIPTSFLSKMHLF